MTDELQELEEHAESAAHDPSLAPVSLTMAILSVLVAIATLLGHRSHTEEVSLRSRTNDVWSYYQGKDTRYHMDKAMADLEGFIATADPAKAAQARAANLAEAEKYRKQEDDLEAEAKQLEQETNFEKRRADRFDVSEIFLEVALVVTSITLLSGRRTFWHTGVVLGLVGIVIAATGFLIH